MVKRFYRHIFHDIFSFGILVGVSICIGLLINQLRDDPLPLRYHDQADRLRLAVADMTANKAIQSVPLALSGSLSLNEFRAFAIKKGVIVIDARPEIFYRFSHIPGAISLPRDDFEVSYTKYKSKLEINKDQAIVVYCSSASCEDSRMVQRALIALGYRQVFVFRGGWNEWTHAGYPTENSS